jgi:hypothetical protein
VTHEPEQSATPKRTALVAHVVFGVGGRIASTVYGTVVVMATLTGAYASEHDPWRLAVIVSSTVLVLWIAHLYAHSVSESIESRRRLTREELTNVGRRELGIVLAAVAPVVALLLGAGGVLRESSAVWLALAVGLATLAAEGARYARLERLGRAMTLASIATNLALGLFVVALKVAVGH